ncbi:MAG: oxidoreductase [Deltaproteobacteria bacterium]|nr:oxidoreductase [Deltaproteobacteria bacterium]
MNLLLCAVSLLLLGGVASLLAGRRPGLANGLGAGSAVAGCLLGLWPSARLLAGGSPETLLRPWSVPGGSFHLVADPLAAFFLLAILGLSAAAAAYGAGYLRPQAGRRNLGAAWFFYNLLVAAMVLVVLAANAVLFLVAWEVMSLASYFLVTFEHQRESVRRAGWIYLVATHLGTACLLVMFLLLGQGTGSLELVGPAAPRDAGLAGLIFLLAVVGFGTKAGFIPLHVWLPEAHPAAPSHVSAVMSGVMIKTGIYGILRLLTLLGPPAAWWGWLLLGLGLVSGVLGVLFALAQHDLKRLLAYHSVENIGIIGLGLGLGVLGLAWGKPGLAVLGLAGGLLHVWNHALFKGLLFLGAGAVLHATGTGDLERLGGLGRRMPWTAALFLLGSVAICGLPPLNGFVSEFLIYFAGFQSLGAGAAPAASLAGLLVLLGLALIGGLAVACFTKAYGIVFLGEPRSPEAAAAHAAGPALRWPMLALALGCVAVAGLAPQAAGLLTPLLAGLTGLTPAAAAQGLAPALPPLTGVVLAAGGLLLALGLLAWLRRRLLAGRPVAAGPTWDCGYIRPTARMQYTASSFAQPLTRMFNFVLWTPTHTAKPRGFFPAAAHLATHPRDGFLAGLYLPLFRGLGWLLLRTHGLQQGRVQVYLLYLAVLLLLLLIFFLR